MIRVSQVVKYHGTTRVLNEATLVANPGELTVLIGPSGGGKSTLLRCINGLEAFHTGTIEVFGHILEGTNGVRVAADRLVPVRRKVGMVFQQFNLFPHMTALQNVMCGPIHALGQSPSTAEATAKRLLERVGLGERMSHKPANLSGGQQQRVAIARALAVEPAAILFDEPTSALDPQVVEEVLSVMRSLADEGQTMIVVTHDMDLARRATVVHRMVAGQVAQSGPPETIFN
jgi:ABC-type polar amino acid transport system ATPase subunit